MSVHVCVHKCIRKYECTCMLEKGGEKGREKEGGERGGRGEGWKGGEKGGSDVKIKRKKGLERIEESRSTILSHITLPV